MPTARYKVTKRKKDGIELPSWYLRVYVPKALQGAVGRAEILRSLDTGDRRAAERKAAMQAEECFAEWDGLAQAGAPTGVASVPTLAAKRVYEPVLAALEASRRTLPDDDAAYAEAMSKRQAELLRLTRWRQDNLTASWEAIADRIIEREGRSTTKGSEEYRALVAAIGDATIDAYYVHNQRSSGDVDAAPRTKVVREALETEAKSARKGETLLELFERWATERLAKGEKRLDTVNQDRKVIQQFAAFVGEDRSVASITAHEVFDYREALRALPPKWSAKRELNGMGMREAAAKARELGLPQTAFTTINKHLSTISPLYKWLAGQPAWLGLSNPCSGLFHDKVKGKNPRPPFTTGDLNKIISSPLFTGFEADGKEHLRGERCANDWRYWVPLVCLFTGARIGEIAQLRVEDVRLEQGVWFIHIRHDPSKGQFTKSGKSRAAPVHSKLAELGFLDLQKAQATRADGSGNDALFPELKPNNRDQISGKVSRWWRDYLESIGVKDGDIQGGDGFGSHSFRHTLADRMRVEAELLDHQIAVALGHNQKSTTGGYGRLPQGTVSMLKGYFEGVRFEGVDLSVLC